LEPNDNLALAWLGWACLRKGMHREALAEFRKMRPAGDPKNAPFIACAYAAAGNREEALKILGGLEKQSMQRYIQPYRLAVAYAELGEKEKTFAWLQKAFAVYDGAMNYIKVDPPLDPFRSDPRFQDLLRRMNFPP